MMLRVARRAMATRFECALEGPHAPRLQAAGERMLDEIDRWERILSFYDPASELSRLNREAGGGGPVRVSADLFRVLATCAQVVQASGGAFDPTLAPVLRKWGLAGARTAAGRADSGRVAPGSACESAEHASAASTSHAGENGWAGVELNSTHRTVRFTQPGLSIDLGGIGKGSALNAVRDLALDEGWMHSESDGVTDRVLKSVLVHGGTSSAVALAGPFRIGIEDPHRQGALLDTVELTNEALSVSAVMGKSVDDQKQSGVRRGHVVDPETREPLTVERVAAVVGPDAEFADAWATALVVRPTLFPPPGPVGQPGPGPWHIRQWMVFESGPDGTWKRIAGGG